MVWESGLKESQQSCNRQRQFGDKKVIPWVYKAFFQLESGRRLEQPPRQCERSQHSGRVQTLLQAAPRDHSGTRNRRMKGDQETKVPPSYNILIRTLQWTAEGQCTALSSSLKFEPFADLFSFYGSRHCMWAYIRWFKEEEWKYFLRFVFVCFTS